MPSLTIRDLEPETREKLRRRGASHGRSVQEEARKILRDAPDLPEPMSGRDLYRMIRDIVEPIGGIDIELPPRDLARDPPSFD